ncbi:MAG: hypothetical protein P9L92_10880 [Candidatus Electryonea clarkiae]|nr:hypothetical protein [Candidatus Electryonea clarkiae]MDP8286280.1 hypothetical protein [Candidatus Electryonea clarkiae]
MPSWGNQGNTTYAQTMNSIGEQLIVTHDEEGEIAVSIRNSNDAASSRALKVEGNLEIDHPAEQRESELLFNNGAKKITVTPDGTQLVIETDNHEGNFIKLGDSRLATEFGAHINGNTGITGTGSGGFQVKHNEVIITGDTSIDGDTTIDGDTAVSGHTEIGTSESRKDLTVSRHIYVNSKVIAEGDPNIEMIQVVAPGKVYISEVDVETIVQGAMQVIEGLVVQGDTNVNGTLRVGTIRKKTSGTNITIRDPLSIKEPVSISETLEVADTNAGTLCEIENRSTEAGSIGLDVKGDIALNSSGPVRTNGNEIILDSGNTLGTGIKFNSTGHGPGESIDFYIDGTVRGWIDSTGFVNA